jgi:hypothetical protein
MEVKILDTLECCESDGVYARPCAGEPQVRYFPTRGKTHWNGNSYCDAHWEEIEFMLG